MFGYVTPCVMELKVKDHEKFKGYYCGLCTTIKKNFGNLPRLALNYDMTFLAVLIDSLNDDKNHYKQSHCIAHPKKKRLMIYDNAALDYASFCNIALAYYKLLDDVEDDKSVKSKMFSKILDGYIKNNCNKTLDYVNIYIRESLSKLQRLENNPTGKTIDEISDPFADLTGFIISYYYKDEEFKETLYWLGYNLGKWIYLIDAWDDLEEDMQKQKFNPLNALLNDKNLNYEQFSKSIENRIDFLLATCARISLEQLENLDLKKNDDILYNTLQYGLMEKMDKVFKRSESNERSI